MYYFGLVVYSWRKRLFKWSLRMSFSSTFSAAIWVLNESFLRQTVILWYQQNCPRCLKVNSIQTGSCGNREQHSDPFCFSHEVCNEYETLLRQSVPNHFRSHLTPTQHIQCKQPSLQMNELLIRLKLW